MKTDVKCGVACQGGGDNNNIECPNLDAPHLRSQKGLRVWERDDEGESRNGRKKWEVKVIGD